MNEEVTIKTFKTFLILSGMVFGPAVVVFFIYINFFTSIDGRQSLKEFVSDPFFVFIFLIGSISFYGGLKYCQREYNWFTDK